MVPLGEILRKSEEWVTLEPDKKYREVTVRLWGKGVVQRREVTGAEIAASKRLVVRSQQFILSRIDARNGAFGLVPNSLGGAVVSNDFPVFTPDSSRILPAFLDWMSKTRTFVDFCKLASEGTTNRVRLVEDRFLATEIPLPPLEEQRRIAARIEELAVKIDEARGLRRTTAVEADALLRSKLAAIVDALLIKNGSRQLSALILDAGYGTSVKCEYERRGSHVPVLRIPNVALERITLDDMKYGMLSHSEWERVLLAEGDVLIVRTNGSLDLVGRSAVVPALCEATAFASYLIRLRCDRNTIVPAYLQLMLKHLRTDGQLIDFARTTAGQYNVSLGRLRGARIPVPPLLEQQRIIADMKDLQAQVDALKRLQTETASELDALLPSILDRAFRGEL